MPTNRGSFVLKKARPKADDAVDPYLHELDKQDNKRLEEVLADQQFEG